MIVNANTVCFTAVHLALTNHYQLPKVSSDRPSYIMTEKHTM